MKIYYYNFNNYLFKKLQIFDFLNKNILKFMFT